MKEGEVQAFWGGEIEREYYGERRGWRKTRACSIERAANFYIYICASLQFLSVTEF